MSDSNDKDYLRDEIANLRRIADKNVLVSVLRTGNVKVMMDTSARLVPNVFEQIERTIEDYR